MMAELAAEHVEDNSVILDARISRHTEQRPEWPRERGHGCLIEHTKGGMNTKYKGGREICTIV